MKDRGIPDQGIGRLAVAVFVGMALLLATAIGFASIPSRYALSGEVALLWLNVVLITGAIVVETSRRPYSLHLMHLVAAFLFLGAAALFQFTSGYLGVAGPVASVRSDLAPAAFIVTLWLVGYTLGYEFLQVAVRDIRPGPALRILWRPLENLQVAIVGVFAIVVLVYLASIGLGGAETRAGAREVLSDFAQQAGGRSYTGPVYLIHNWLLRAFPLVAALAAWLLVVRGRGRRGVGVLLVAAALALGILALNNPFAASRMWLQTAIIAFVAPFVLVRLRTGWALIAAVIFGVTLLPSLHFSRYAESFDEFLFYFELSSPFEYLATSSDVDSLGMLALCVRWVESHGHRWGLQILGALFSWIPRAIWPSKPIGTGKMVTEDLGFSFTNLSPPLPSEVFVDFGLVGVPIAAALFGAVLWRLDRAYWDPPDSSRRGRPRIIDCVYPFWLGCIVYLVRGDLFAAFTQTAAFTFWILPFALSIPLRRPGSRGGSDSLVEAEATTCVD